MPKNKKPLFQKLFYRYTAILICIVAVLVLYFISATKSRVQATNIDYMKMMNEKATDYLKQCADNTGYINADLYQSSGVFEDLLNYMRLESEEYQKYRLDQYMASPLLSYEGFDDYMEKVMQSYPSITHIELVSYEQGRITDCYPNGKNYISNEVKTRIAEAADENLTRDGEFSYVREIRDPVTMQSVGCMIISFQSEEFEEIQRYYSQAELFIYNKSGKVVHQSYAEMDEHDLLEAIETDSDENYLRAYIQKTDVAGYTVYSYMNKQKASRLPLTAFLAIISLGLLAVAAGELCVHYYLRHLEKRMEVIVNGMDQVMTGDLNVRLPVDLNGDELDVIAGHFNEMCVRLDRYIKKSYLAEIEQKNAELSALQSQINPHFLYNTLEAIRMKALMNGDREVGKMLYSMAVIFRSQIKEADVITVVQEIHYCKKYLELFEYRYAGKFTSEVECPEELMNYPIIKFVLQPLIENYFVHGIRTEEDGNIIRIWVEKAEDDLLIHLEDNGRGMTEEELDETNRKLRENPEDSRNSIGLQNVNRRIKAVYGEEYGIKLGKSQMGGLHVTVRAGIKGV